MSASNPSDGLSQNQNTPFGRFFASATQSSDSSAPPGVPSGFTTFPAFGSLSLNDNTLSSNNNSTTKAFSTSNPFTTQSTFGCPPSNSFSGFGGTGAASTSTTTTSSSPSFGFGFTFNKIFANTRPPHPAFKFPGPFTFFQPGFDYSRTPLYCFLNIPFSQKPKLFTDPPQFKASTSTPSSHVQVCKNCGHKSFWGQLWGSRVVNFCTPTLAIDEQSSALFSISAMPMYKDKCHEELRFEDYEFQGKKHTWNAPVNESTPFGQPMLTFPVLMLPVAIMPTATSFRPS